jgi:GNAT superfamily N-acetyltransferase
MSIVVRPIQPLEYAAAAAIHNADNEPHFQTSAERLQESDERQTNGSRLVAVRESEVIGTAEFWSWPEVEAYRVGIHALEPESQLEAQGLMLITIESAARTRGVKRLLATVRADFLVNAPFLQFGFSEVFRSFGANLELTDFEPERFADLEPALNARDITIKSYAELEGDASRAAKLEAIQREVLADLPSYEPVVPANMDYKDRRLWEPFFVAMRGDEYLGFASLDGKPDGSVVHFDASGVSRSHRRQGIGLALAAKLTAWAKQAGFAELNDGGARSNAAHIGILERLGFELEPDWVTFEKMMA